MGGTLSCLTPSDSQGVSPSKKHPGRAEAIAEYKARKNAGKPKPEEAVINLSEKVESKPIAVDKAIVEKSPEKEVKQVEKTEEDVVEEVKEEIEEAKEEIVEKVPEVDDAVELSKGDNVDEVEKIDEVEVVTKEVDLEEAKEVSAEEIIEVKAEEVDADVQAADTKTAEIDTENIVEEDKPVIAEVEDLVTPVEKEVTPLPVIQEIDEPTAIASEAVLTTPTVSPLINARRHIFETGDDSIPEAKDLDMDVKDPVTGDMVTLGEYRRRQSERARGVVKEHVEKYESIDEKALKEIETLKLQEESKSKGREGSRNWTVPEPSSPSSPKPSPSKKDFTIQTL